MNKLADLIQRRLAELGLKKSDLAKMIGVSRSYVVNMANQTGNTQSGQYRPSPEVVEKLAKSLEVSEEEILKAIGYNVRVFSETTVELFYAIEKLPEQSKKEVIDFIKFKISNSHFENDVESKLQISDTRTVLVKVLDETIDKTNIQNGEKVDSKKLPTS